MSLLQIEPTGQYSRKIWYNEWLLQTELPIADLAIKITFHYWRRKCNIVLQA
jgi:hypothetical protein